MPDLLLASNLALWLAAALLGVLVYALARQVGALSQRIAPAGALMVNEVLRVGDAAPEVTVQDLGGGQLTLGGAPESGAWPRSTLVFFLAPDCPVCKSLLPVLRSVARSESWLDIVLASDGGEPAEHQAFVDEQGLAEFPYALSEALGRAYGVGKLPYAVLIDEHGNIVSLGLVNSREHLESLFEAKELNTPSIQDYVRQQGRSAQLDDRMGIHEKSARTSVTPRHPGAQPDDGVGVHVKSAQTSIAPRPPGAQPDGRVGVHVPAVAAGQAPALSMPAGKMAAS